MVVCYIFGCNSGCSSKKGQQHLFKINAKATENVKNQWRRNIPKRADKKWAFETCVICDKHFEERFIIKINKVIAPDGEIMAQEPRKRWTLTEDAVPTMFSSASLPSYLRKASATPRQPPRKRTENKPRKLSPQKSNSNDNIQESTAGMEQEIVPMDNAGVKRPLLMTDFRVKVPNSWILNESPQGLEYCKLVTSTTFPIKTFHAERSVEIFPNGETTILIRSKVFNQHFLKSCIASPEELISIIEAVDKAKICNGVPGFNIIKNHSSAYKCGTSWISIECHQLLETLESEMCDKCSTLKILLRKAVGEIESPSQSKKSKNALTEILSKKSKLAQRRIKRLELRNRKIKAEMKNLNTKLKSIELNSLQDVLDRSGLIGPNLKCALMTAARKVNGHRGRRYTCDWLLQSLLLKTTSPKAYKHLREENLLPLPHPSYLTKMLSGIKCQFGFSKFVFEHLQKEFSTKTRRDRQVFIVFDEMKVKESIEFDKCRMQFSGFIDYAEFTEDYQYKKGSKLEADHALVFMVRCLNSRMTQPVGCFATKGSAPGNVLAKILLSCVLKVEEAGLEVAGVVCDGASSNKTAWKILGIKGECNSVVNKITNPADEFRSIHFLCDIPHIIKCIRNHFFKNTVCMFRGSMINWGFFEALFDIESQHVIRAAPKLTIKHVRPGPFQKMSVALAVQVFSKSVADALKYYRDSCNHPNLKYSHGTESFIRTLNDLFDVCNARIPEEGLKPGSPKCQILSNFLLGITDSDTFASYLTMASIRVTLASILDLVKYLCEDVGFKYVLTAKFNQDCLEKFFGLVRSYGGDDSHPTISSFGHIYRILSVFSPTSRLIKGNVRSDEEISVNSISYMETLKAMRLTRDQEMLEVRNDLEARVLGKILYSSTGWTSLDVINEHCYASLDPLSGIVYQLCGYLAYKGKMFTDCVACLTKLEDSTYKPAESVLTTIKNMGGLKFPSKPLHQMISQEVEPILSSLSVNDISSQSLASNIIDKVECLHIEGIGCCEEHSNSLAIKIVLYYITIRMFFYRNMYNKEKLTSCIKSKEKMKESKLK